MNRLAANHGGHGAVIGPDRHPLADELLRIPAADGLRVEKAGIAGMRDEHANLIAVTGEHHPPRCLGIFGGDHVAMQIDSHAIGKRRRILADDLLNRLLVAGGTRRGEQLLE